MAVADSHQELQFAASADCDQCSSGSHVRMYLHLIATRQSPRAIWTTLKSIADTRRKELQNVVYTDGETVTRPPCCQFTLISPNEFSVLLSQNFSVQGPQTLLVRRLFHHWVCFAVRILSYFSSL